MTYEEQLKDRRWWMFRKVILLRDNNRCTRCGSYRNLQAHHLYYTPGKMAWEYPFEAAVTLCDYCHGMTHGKNEMTDRCGDIQSIGMVVSGWIQNEQNKISNAEKIH